MTRLLVLAVWIPTFWVFDTYDWGHPWWKLAAYGALLGLLALPRPPRRGPAWPWGLAALGAAAWGLHRVLPDLAQAPSVDIGYLTDEAVRLLFLQGRNPYEAAITRYSGLEGLHGYPYGPGMLLGFAPAALLGPWGVKALNGLWLAAAVLLTARLAREDAAFAVLCLLLPARLWTELFQAGVVDMLPTVLVLLSITLLHHQSFWPAGLAAGLALSCKWAPAVFLLALLVRRDSPRAFLGGVAAGLLPLAAFAAASPGALWRSTVWAHSAKAFDDTSLRSLAPAEWQWVFPLALVLGAALILRREARAPSLLRHFTLLTVLANVTHGEVHVNHLLWVLPSAAILVAAGAPQPRSRASQSASLRS